jgi:C1A family cysteine protease
MVSRKIRFQPKWIVAILMVFFLVFGLGQMAVYAAGALGDIPLDPETYQRYLKTYSDALRDAVPSSYDARNDGIVTPAKNQGGCGSCWAFASVGAMESHLMKKWGYGLSDLSEQQQLSCNTEMSGCVGGSSSAIKWWDEAHGNGPIDESCFPYTASDTTPCSYSCTDMVTRVVDWHTVAEADFKASCYNKGPSYWRFNVYSDFNTFWDTAPPGAVYVSQSGTVFRGGHAVLLIGWDDAKGAYLSRTAGVPPRVRMATARSGLPTAGITDIWVLAWPILT